MGGVLEVVLEEDVVMGDDWVVVLVVGIIGDFVVVL